MPKKPIYKQAWFWIVIIIILLTISNKIDLNNLFSIFPNVPEGSIAVGGGSAP